MFVLSTTTNGLADRRILNLHVHLVFQSYSLTLVKTLFAQPSRWKLGWALALAPTLYIMHN